MVHKLSSYMDCVLLKLKLIKSLYNFAKTRKAASPSLKCFQVSSLSLFKEIDTRFTSWLLVVLLLLLFFRFHFSTTRITVTQNIPFSGTCTSSIQDYPFC